MQRRKLEEGFFKVLMVGAFALVSGSLLLILITILWRGLPALNLAMLTQTSAGGFYLGGEGGILNAIAGSFYMASAATVLAVFIGLPIALHLHTYARNKRWNEMVRLALDVLWGVPSIVIGAFGFTIMLWMGLRASMLGGIIVLTILEIPIMTRGMDEVIGMVPVALKESSYALGATRLETALRVLIKQTLPGLLTAVMLAFGRGIGDAASVLFTAGYSDRMPDSLLSPAASLPLAVIFQLGTPFPLVQQRAYASALILTLIVLILSLSSRWLAGRMRKNIIL